MTKKILIIDDEIGKKGSTIHEISQRLKSNGYEIIPCKSFDYEGQIKPLIIKDYRDLRLVICDLLDKKTIHGWDVIESIKHKQNRIEENVWFTSYLPIIVVTQAEEEDYQGKRDTYRKQHVTLFGKPVSDVFYGCVDVLTELFDSVCQEKMRYKIAISYTWYNKETNDNHQSFVEIIAHRLYQEYKKDRIFYDIEKISNTAGLLSEELAKKVYEKGCDYVLVFLTKDYTTTLWTEKEWQHIKQLGHNRYIFVVIEDLNKDDKHRIAYNLFRDEWEKAGLNKDFNKESQEKKEKFFNDNIPLYLDFHESKKRLGNCTELKSLDEYLNCIKDIEERCATLIIDKIKKESA